MEPRVQYYISNSGDDNNDGLSEATPWRTVSKVNASLPHGAKARFKCGDVWRENITAVYGYDFAYTCYTSYGEGENPLFLGSLDKSLTSDWEDLGGNIWKCSGLTTDIGNIIFGDDESCGVKLQAEDGLNTQGEFWYDFVNDLVKIYSVGNPASVYSHIELCVTQNQMEGADYSEFIGLTLKYGGRHGINYTDKRNGRVLNCRFYYIGGGDQNSDYTVRLGNAIQFWQNAYEIIAEHNYIYDCYDAGITPQAITAGKLMQNITMRYNTIARCEQSFEFWNSGAGSITKNIIFSDNVCLDAGQGMQHNQRWDDVRGSHIDLSHSDITAGVPFNVRIENNYFGAATEWAILLWRLTDKNQFIMNNNTYSSGSIAYCLQNTTEYKTLAEWQTATGQDLNSTFEE